MAKLNDAKGTRIRHDLIQPIWNTIEQVVGRRGEMRIEEGIVYITFPDGTYIDFTVPHENIPLDCSNA